ncbi:MAG: Tol-Pal system beta propeller repeat protein TolB [Candidatus Rokubacteria bacterium]|nr:Tol-Pal system beta propeller repeat protein TolB [Candidatus Rokubacteria bacterium]
MRSARGLGLLPCLLLSLLLAANLGAPRPSHSQAVDVFLNVMAGGAKKLNIAVPEFTLVARTDTRELPRKLSEVAGADLRFSALFSVVAGTSPLPADDPEQLKRAWGEFAAAGAHAGLHGLLALGKDLAEAEMRLYDLTNPDFRLIAAKKFTLPTTEARRLAHKIADEVVYQFTGEAGIADTKIAAVGSASGSKELYVMDYDGVGTTRLTMTDSINLSPVWSPDARSVAFTSYMYGYPYLYRLFVFERRPIQLLAGFLGINSTPAWSPDGKSVAMTLTKDGNPDIYVLNVATGTLRRLTSHWGIDTEPFWSPTGRELTFVSERAGPAQIFIMDAEGTNVRRLTFAGFNTQPRWSPKGDVIVYTSRQGSLDLWAVTVDGSNPRRLTNGPGFNESASWAPNGRHLIFQSNRPGGWRLFTMLADGSEQQQLTRGPGEFTSPSWSARFP